MSETGSSYVSDGETEIRFACRLCPGTSFNAAEKEEHKQFHRMQRKAKGSQPRPARQPGSPIPVVSYVPLSDGAAKPAEDVGVVTPPAKRARSDEGGSHGGIETPPTPLVPRTGARRSVKKYDDAIIGSWSKGNGA